MRILTLLFISVLSWVVSIAQEYTVRSFEIEPNDLSARIKSRVDGNGKKCALIKVYTDDKIAEVQGSIVGEIEGNGMEKWVYLTHDAKKMKLIFERHLPLEVVFMDYNYPSVTGQMTYVLKLQESSDFTLDDNAAAGTDAVRDKAVKAYDNEDYKTAYELFSSIPEDKVAQTYLGIMYTKSRGVEHDDAKAVEWLRKAAEQGYARAQCNLGAMYANGIGVKTDYMQAFEWFLKAAGQGHARAQYYLGGMYENGADGVPQDSAKAIYWYRKSAEQGNGYAKEALERLDR